MTKPKNTRKKPSLSETELEDIRDHGAVGRYLGAQLRLTHINALNALQQDFAPYQSSPVRFTLLEQVNELPGSTQATLASLMDVDRTTLVPIISDMEAKGLLRKKVLSTDKRAFQIWITQKGKKLLDELRPLAHAHEQRLCEGMSEEQRLALIETLRDIRRNIAKIY